MRGASVVGSSTAGAQDPSRTRRTVGSVFARVRVVVAALALMARVVPAMAEPTPPQGAQSTMSAAGESSLNDERARLPPMTIPQDARSNDRRTAYVGAGVVVLAVMFWWNRRRRDRFEREDRRPPARVAARNDDDDDDDDADDLHAAAHSDASAAPDPPDRPHRKARPDRRDRRDP